MIRVDLNCDVGESVEDRQLALEERILSLVTSVNIACGLHAGTPAVMRRLVRAARALGVAIGAHPGFNDPASLGRKYQRLTREEVEALVAYQVGALAGIVSLEGGILTHVKPHGALYNQAAQDQGLSEAIVRGVASVDGRLRVVGLAGSCLIEAARAAGLTAVEEAFADRGYRADGTLMPRGEPGAVLEEMEVIAARAVSLVREGVVSGPHGEEVRVRAETICVHADTPAADHIIACLRAALEAAGFRVAAPGAGADE